MTKRFKKKMLKASISVIQFGWDLGVLVVKSVQLAALQLYDIINDYTKNFSVISILIAVSIIALLISLMFGPFKVCEFLVVCWLSEVLWLWFRGEC